MIKDALIQVLSTSGARAYSLFAGIIVLFLTARWLGPEGRGIIAAVTTWVALFFTVGYLSLGQVALHIANKRKEPEALAQLLGTLLAFTGVATLLGWGVASGAYLATNGKFFGDIAPELLTIGFLSLPLLIWEQYGSSLLMSRGLLSVYNLAQVAGRTAGIAVVVVALTQGFGVRSVLWSILIAQVIVSGAGLFRLFVQAGRSLQVHWGTLRELLDGGVKLHLNALGTYFFSSAAILLMNSYRSKAEVGSYQLALQLIGALMIIPNSGTMVIYSRMSSLGVDAVWPLQKQLFWRLGGAVLAIAAMAAFVAPSLILRFAGPGFGDSGEVLRILLLGLVGVTVSAVMSPQWIGRGLFWQASCVTLALGLFSLALLFLLVPRYGMKGAAWTFVATYLVGIIPNLVLAWRVERKLGLGTQ